MRAISSLFMLLLSLSLVSSVMICVDKDDPSMPQELTVSGEVGNIVLSWLSAIDSPECSGILEYKIVRDGELIGVVGKDNLSFVDIDSLAKGEYDYTVFAIDMVGHNEGVAIKNTIKIDKDLVVHRGGSSSSRKCVEEWICGNWTDCVGEKQERICTDDNKCGTIKDKPEILLECGEESGHDYDSDGSSYLNNDKTKEFPGKEEKGFFSSITGGVIGTGSAVIDVLGEGGTAISGILLVGLLGGGLLFVRKKRQKKELNIE